jgi:hypothetical protein
MPRLLALLLGGLGDMGPEGLATSGWALARLAHVPGRRWQAAYLDATAACLGRQQWQPKQLSLLAWSAATLGLQPSAVWLDRLLQASQPQLASANPQALANLAWALGRLQAAPGASWRDAFLAASSSMLQARGALLAEQPRGAPTEADCSGKRRRGKWQQQAKPLHLAQLGWAAVRLGWQPGEEWLARYAPDCCSYRHGCCGIQKPFR